MDLHEDLPEGEFGFAQAMETSGPFDMIAGPSPREMARMAQVSVTRLPPGEGEPSMEVQAPGVEQSEAQIAYSYAYGFRVDAEDLPTLQQRHRDLCEEMGKMCRVLSLSQSGTDEYGFGRMRLEVAAAQAGAFEEQLSAATDGLDAEQISFSLSGEDLTESIIDTEAHLESRLLLRDRLMEVLRNRGGSVGDLVEAERGVAEVNEEIDAARSRLENLRGRIDYSDVSVDYDPALGEYRVGFLAPIGHAFERVGSTLGVVIAGIIYFTVAMIPITAFLLAVRWLWRKSGLRLRRRKEPAGTTDA